MGKNGEKIIILFATSVRKEWEMFQDIIQVRGLNYELVEPQDVRDADSILSSRPIDIIITDLEFSHGAFADWLVLWPRPFILLAYYGEEPRVDLLIKDESSSYVMRDSENRHLGALPIMIRKVLNVRESLERQNTHLQISERRYLDLVSSLPDIVYTLDGDGHFIYINESVIQLGYRPEELLGKHFSYIVDEEDVASVSRNIVLPGMAGVVTGPEKAPKLFDERRTGARMTRNLELRLRPNPLQAELLPRGLIDSYGEVSCVGYTLPEYEGCKVGTVGIIRDITSRKLAELKLMENLRVKEVLLKEIHHRVKNNLQVISSLLNLQAASIEDEYASKVFTECQNQIQAMAMVHEQLYHSDNLQSIDMEAFLRTLVRYLLHIYELDRAPPQVSILCHQITLGIDVAIPLALMLNELISNSLKHGKLGVEDRISVDLSLEGEDRYLLQVTDTGPGLPADFDLATSTTMGFQLIQALSDQIGATVAWKSGEGLSFAFAFSYEQPI